VVIPRIYPISIFIFPFILFPIVVLHQLGIRANSDPHVVTQSQHSANLPPTTQHLTSHTHQTTSQISTKTIYKNPSSLCITSTNQKKKKKKIRTNKRNVASCHTPKTHIAPNWNSMSQTRPAKTHLDSNWACTTIG
jgi:CelD/BcsL family acetyltransferase involved in cellulose biosynthesis